MQKNPVVLDAHQYTELPVGRVNDLHVDGKRQLVASITFASDVSERAKQIEDLYRGGFMHSFSVGFAIVRSAERGQPLPDGRAWPEGASWVSLETELQDVSTVSVPSDVNATMLRSLAKATGHSREDSAWAYGLACRVAPKGDAATRAAVCRQILTIFARARAGAKLPELLHGEVDASEQMLGSILDALNAQVIKSDRGATLEGLKADVRALLAQVRG